MIISYYNGKRIQTRRRPNPMQTFGCAWIYRWTKNGGKLEPGRRATGRAIMGRWAVAGRGRRKLDLRAFGPPGRRGPVFSKTPGPGCSKRD